MNYNACGGCSKIASFLNYTGVTVFVAFQNATPSTDQASLTAGFFHASLALMNAYDIKEVEADMANDLKLVQTTEHHIVINWPEHCPYRIPLNECETRKAEIAWVFQISRKSWATVKIIELFLSHAENHIGKIGIDKV